MFFTILFYYYKLDLAILFTITSQNLNEKLLIFVSFTSHFISTFIYDNDEHPKNLDEK